MAILMGDYHKTWKMKNRISFNVNLANYSIVYINLQTIQNLFNGSICPEMYTKLYQHVFSTR